MTEQPKVTAPECAECGSAMAVVPLLIGTGMQCTACTHWYPLPLEASR
jgi:hypothetical protein